MKRLVSTAPAENYTPIGDVLISTPEEIHARVEDAHNAKAEWKDLGIEGRIALLEPICKEFEERANEIASVISLEVGMPINDAFNEVLHFTGQVADFMEQGRLGLQETQISADGGQTYHRKIYEPRGATAVITPWNMPFGMAMWGIMPNLIAGNTVVYKASEECPLTGQLIDDIFANNNLSVGVFSEVYGDGEVGEQLVKENVDFIWFTGSSTTGRKINNIASNKFIPAMLEMGGSNPCVVFPDADINLAVDRILHSRYANNGQTCDAIKRLIVHQEIADELLDTLGEGVENLRTDHPEAENVKLGSLVAKRQLDLVVGQVNEAVGKGAYIHARSQVPSDLIGAYYPALILDDVAREMRVWREEVFAPVLPVIDFKTESEAIMLANDTVYGLGAVVISEDRIRARRVASKIVSGTVDINKGDHWTTIWNPFGGRRSSGNGREHGIEGMQALCEIKVITE